MSQSEHEFLDHLIHREEMMSDSINTEHPNFYGSDEHTAYTQHQHNIVFLQSIQNKLFDVEYAIHEAVQEKDEEIRKLMGVISLAEPHCRTAYKQHFDGGYEAYEAVKVALLSY